MAARRPSFSSLSSSFSIQFAKEFTKQFAGVAAAYYRKSVSRTLLFWAAFILTRPLGAMVGDFLDKPLNAGGLALSRYTASAVLLTLILLSTLLIRQRAARSAH